MEKAPYLEPEEIGAEECSQLLVKPYSNNTLQEVKEGIRVNLSAAPSISSTDLLSASKLCKIHPLLVNLFPVKIKQLPKAGRMKHFRKNCQKLTNDPMILHIVGGYEILFILSPMQSKLPNLCQLAKEASDLVHQEVQDMLKKSAIVVSDPKEDQFLSSLFLVKKKVGAESPSSQPKGPEQQYSLSALQDGGLFLLKEMLLPEDKMCKTDLKDPYFAILLSVKSRKCVRFQWKGLLCKFCCLCFRLSPAPLVLTKLLKVTISLLRKLNVRIIIYLDEMLLMASSLEYL